MEASSSVCWASRRSSKGIGRSHHTAAGAAIWRLVVDDFVQSIDDLNQLFGTGRAQSRADPFHRQRSYLADLHPRFLRQSLGLKLERQPKARSLRFAGLRHGNDGPGPFIEDIMTEDQHGTPPRLFIALDWIEIRPPNLSS